MFTHAACVSFGPFVWLSELCGGIRSRWPTVTKCAILHRTGQWHRHRDGEERKDLHHAQGRHSPHCSPCHCCLCCLCCLSVSGVVGVGEASVLICVSSPHRRESLEAVSWCIDELKRVLCVWKKEWYEDGSVWKQNAEWNQQALTQHNDKSNNNTTTQ